MKVTLWACRDKNGNVNLSKKDPEWDDISGYWILQNPMDMTENVSAALGLFGLRRRKKKRVVIAVWEHGEEEPRANE